MGGVGVERAVCNREGAGLTVAGGEGMRPNPSHSHLDIRRCL